MKVQITQGMLMALIINMVYAKAIGLTQGSMAREVGNDIWISTLIGGVEGVLLMLFTVAVMKRMPERDMINQAEDLAGKWLGKLIAFLFFAYFFAAYGVIMATFVYHLKDYFLPDAPILLFILIAIVVGSYGIFFGLEVVGRMALIGVFFVIGLNILLLLDSFEDFDIRELLPVLQAGVGNTTLASRHHATDWTMTTMMVALILPMVKGKEKWTKASVAGVIFGLGIVSMWPIVEVGVLSAEVTAQYVVSCMQMARSAQVGLYIHRYEMIMIALFSVSILVQIMMSLFCSAVSLQRLFGAKDYRPFIIPVSLLLGGFGYWLVFDHRRAIHFMENGWVAIGMSVAVMIPLIVFLLGLVMRKWKKAG